jgi:hypothetical protein
VTVMRAYRQERASGPRAGIGSVCNHRGIDTGDGMSERLRCRRGLHWTCDGCKLDADDVSILRVY